MASYSKIDPTCDSGNRIVFVGNVSLRPYNETDTRYLSDKASAELIIDVISSPAYQGYTFHDIHLFLEIQMPASARFVEHGNRNNYHWDVPDGVGGWVENPVSTRQLRIRWDQAELLSFNRPGDGLSHYVGIAGMPDNTEFRFTAAVTAVDVRAVAEACDVTVSLLDIGEGISGYLS